MLRFTTLSLNILFFKELYHSELHKSSLHPNCSFNFYNQVPVLFNGCVCFGALALSFCVSCSKISLWARRSSSMMALEKMELPSLPSNDTALTSDILGAADEGAERLRLGLRLRVDPLFLGLEDSFSAYCLFHDCSLVRSAWLTLSRAVSSEISVHIPSLYFRNLPPDEAMHLTISLVSIIFSCLLLTA